MQNSKLFVGNLDYSVKSSDLQDLFAPYGEVKYIKIIEDKGFGFVEMTTQSEAENAKKGLDGHELKGRQLKIDAAKPQKPKRF